MDWDTSLTCIYAYPVDSEAGLKGDSHHTQMRGRVAVPTGVYVSMRNPLRDATAAVLVSTRSFT
jgi:hypothetical protein